MPFSLKDAIEKREATIASFSGLAGEKALVVAAKNGNEEAFEILGKRYRRRILAVALRVTRVQEDAEDIAQQSFQKAFVHLRKFEGRASFSTWLTQIAVNQGLMLLRRRHRHHEVSIDEDSIDMDGSASRLEIPDSLPDPETSCLQREEARMLFAAMDKLKSGMRKAIELRDLEELSTQETARRMRLSVNTAKSTLSRGRRKLREVLRRQVRSPRIRQNRISAIGGFEGRRR